MQFKVKVKLQLNLICLLFAVNYCFSEENVEESVSLPKPETKATVTDHVYFDIWIGEEYAGRIVIALFGKLCPKTVKNFVELSKRQRPNGYGGGTPVHRVIKQFVMQSGDFTRGDGTGGTSIYGASFADEKFTLKHWKAGMVSMANAGKNTNGSQFFITLAKIDYLNGKHVVFGEVVQGMEVVRQIEQTETGEGDKPITDIVIQSSGVLEKSSASNEE